MSKRRIIRWAGAAIAAVVLLLLVVWAAVTGPRTVYRILRHNVSGIDDARLFSQRAMRASDSPQRFNRAQLADGTVANRIALPDGRVVPLSAALQQTDSVALLVVKDESVRVEQYESGFESGTLAFSVSKAVLGLLAFMAIDDGLFRSLDQPVREVLPETVGRGTGGVTIRQLLQMTSGLDYVENDNPLGIHPRVYYTDDMVPLILQQELRGMPGARFEYKSGDTYLLALALRRALAPLTITAYMQQRLWMPLGMEFTGSWSVDHEPDGLEKVACCLTVAARDLAKIGRLLLDGGRRGERRLVSDVWSRASLQGDGFAVVPMAYQYGWRRPWPERGDVVATGHLGQFLYVNPTRRVIIVRQGRSRGGWTVDEWLMWLRELSESVG